MLFIRFISSPSEIQQVSHTDVAAAPARINSVCLNNLINWWFHVCIVSHGWLSSGCWDLHGPLTFYVYPCIKCRHRAIGKRFIDCFHIMIWFHTTTLELVLNYKVYMNACTYKFVAVKTELCRNWHYMATVAHNIAAYVFHSFGNKFHSCPSVNLVNWDTLVFGNCFVFSSEDWFSLSCIDVWFHTGFLKGRGRIHPNMPCPHTSMLTRNCW